MQVTNHSPFAVAHLAMWDRGGQELLAVVVKCTYAFGSGGRLETAREQLSVNLADEFEQSRPLQLKRPSDFNTGKPGTDLLLMGSAWAPGGEPVTDMLLSVKVGPLAVAARVWGERWNEPSLFGWRLSAPRPFTKLPLTWEMSFGGADPQHPQEDFWAENPIGRGYATAPPASREPVLAPCLEWMDSPYRGFGPPPRTLGFGPVHPAWSPRRQHAGTYDERWRESRAPFVPEDFDSRFFHLAPPYLRTAAPLLGGEEVEWQGFHPAVPSSFRLPRPSHEVVYRRRVLESRLDAVWLRPDEQALSMTWRTLVPLPRSSSTGVSLSVLGKPLIRLGNSS